MGSGLLPVQGVVGQRQRKRRGLFFSVGELAALFAAPQLHRALVAGPNGARERGAEAGLFEVAERLGAGAAGRGDLIAQPREGLGDWRT